MRKYKLSTASIVIVLCFQVIKTEIILSTNDMQSLVDTQGVVIESLEHYLAKEEEKLESIRRFIRLCKEEYIRADMDRENYLKNPINSYKLIKRLTEDLSDIKLLTKINVAYKRPNSVQYPTYEDFIGTVTSLHRLQVTYSLNTTELANGTLTGTFSANTNEYTEYVAPMTVSDCVEMGSLVVEGSKNYNRSISWLKAALQKLQNGEFDVFHFQTESQMIIINALIYAYYKANDFKSQMHWIKKRIQFKPYNETESETANIFKYITHFYNFLMKVHSDTWKTIYLDDNVIRVPHLRALCRGDATISANISKRLSCWYKSGPHPFLRLARVRTELLHRGPDVLLFHDVLSDNEILHLKELAKARTVVPRLISNKIGSVTNLHRISKVAWLEDGLTEVLKQVSARTSHLTDLSMTSAETLQVANYGIGGHYDIHCDFFENVPKYHKEIQKFVETYNNRIATVLFYLSDVEQGGATVFPEYNLTMFPKKGSAVFWMNLLPNGDLDHSTKHTACPVLRGNKWVSNRWIHQHGQEFLRPCPSVQQTKN